MNPNEVICLIDNTTHDNVEHLHLYLRKLKVTQEDYYTKFVPRKDWLTGKPIKFKSLDFYLTANFNNKDNMKEWVLKNPDQAKSWALDLLKKRIENKKLKYSPTQVELASLSSPTMHFYNRIGEYYSICQSFGLTQRFYNKDLVFTPLDKKIPIIEDTREKSPLFLKDRYVIVSKLDVGDYALAEPFDKGIYIERKGLADFAQTLTKGLQRFERELDRAKKSNRYIVMLVEAPIDIALNFDKVPEMKYTKVNPSHVFKNLRDLLVSFNNFQVLFVDSREMAASAVIKIFELGEQVKEVDLQYKLEKGELKC